MKLAQPRPRLPFTLARSLAVLTVLAAFGCSKSPDPDSPASPSDTAAAAGCDAAALDAEATALRSERSDWRNDSGVPLRQAERARTALRTACPASILAPYDAALAKATESSREGRPLLRNEGEDTARVCPTADAAAQDALRREGHERSGFLYDACDLSRYAAVVERDTFVALHANTGATVLLELAETLRGAGVSSSTADGLVRALVLQSGVSPLQPPELLLPAAQGDPVPRHGFAVAVSSEGVATGELFGPLEQLADPDGLLDILGEAADKQRQLASRSNPPGDAGPFILMAHRDTTAAQLAALLVTFERAKATRPILLVLDDDADTPFAVRAIPDVSSESTQTLAELLRVP
ncbi:MAG: hypothetical protein ACRBN8_44415 [Nannocystales bacterium]